MSLQYQNDIVMSTLIYNIYWRNRGMCTIGKIVRQGCHMLHYQSVKEFRLTQLTTDIGELALSAILFDRLIDELTIQNEYLCVLAHKMGISYD